MKKVLALLSLLLWTASVQAQNIEGQIIASQYGKWRVPGYAPNTYSSFAPDSCRVQGGASFFFAFSAGTAIQIVDANPSLTETVTPTLVVNSNVTCAISIAPVNDHQLPFYLASATGGLQEALSQNMTTPATNTVVLDSAWYQLVGAANAAAVIGAAKGGSQLNLVDVTTTPYNWYSWNGTQYVLVPLGGTAGNLGTRQSDILANNQNNSAAVDQDIYISGSPTAGLSTYTPQQAVNAAAAHNGSVILQPGAGRTPFVATGNNRVLDLRNDVPAFARSITEDGAVCDTREVYGTLAAGSTTLTIQNGTLTAADVGRSIVAVGTTSGGVVTQFESAIVSVTDSLHAVLTTPSPFTQAVYHEINLGHDDTAAITKTMNTVGPGGTFVIPAGTCMTHTQLLKGQSPIGLGINSYLVEMPGEDLFQAPDPSLTQGVSQGAAHIHDMTLMFDSRIDATQPWQRCNDSGCTAVTAMYRPVAALSGVAADPLAPGWMVGASNGVASITSGSAVMCVPNAEMPPAVGATVIFPYQATIYTSTVASTAGSCSTGFTARTLNANLTATSAQAEWFAGSSVQNLATAIGSGSCPTSITLSNNINPVAGWESNVPPFGLIQIDGEQFTYFGRSNAGNTSPANTLYGIQCAQNGTTRAAHSASATVFPLNRFKPAYPWPVIPSINTNDTTPSGTATYYPGWNVGNNVFAFPVASGATPIGSGGWSANAKIENLSFFAWPNEINGESWQEVNNTGLIYFVTPHYASTFANLYGLYSSFGISNGPPSLENHAYATAGPTGDGTHWDGLQLYATNPFILATGNQNSFANFNMYSQEGTVSNGTLGANTCFYLVANHDDQNGSYFTAISLSHFKNIYCEPEGGPHAASMPQWEWDTYNSEIEDQHMGGGGEVYIGGGQQHWFGGNFNNAVSTPVIVFGNQNSAMRVANMGSEPKGNVYSANTPINFGWGNDMSGQTAQAFGSTGPWGATQIAGRVPIPSQNGEAFFAGNTTAPFTSLEGGLITPEEFNANFAFEAQAMSVGWTFDDTAPVTHSYTACNVGNNPNSTYCFTNKFNQELIGVGPGQRIVNGKYTMYLSVKDVTAATNTWRLSVGTTCNGIIGTFNIPVTNAWPTSAAQVFTVPVDFTGVATAGCGLGLVLNGATTADQIQISYLAFAPVAEQFNAQTINATTMNLPAGSTGSTSNGCAQSPVTGINNGYTCPTKGDQTTLAANEGASDTTVTVANTSGFSSAGCFFVDGEYQCYSKIVDGTHFGGLTRGAYLTTATTHNSGAGVIGVTLVLGSPQQSPSTVIAYGTTEGQIFAINNGFPYNHGGASVFSVNNGGNEVWWDTGGGMHQVSNGAFNVMQGQLVVGSEYPFHPQIQDSGNLLQQGIAGTAYAPQTLGGGHAGSLNVIPTPTIGAPLLGGALPTGSSTVSWVCSGTDFDGNLIPGTTTTVTNVAATWTYPQGISVGCPWSAGVNTYQIYRTAGGGSQGLLASGVGPGFWVSDFGGVTSGGTPPGSNASSPHISLQGSGNPTITMGTVQILNGSGVPTGCGTTYGNGSLYSNVSGAHSTTNLLYVCDATTTTWVAIE
jgi:hypothetical protein